MFFYQIVMSSTWSFYSFYSQMKSWYLIHCWQYSGRSQLTFWTFVSKYVTSSRSTISCNRQNWHSVQSKKYSNTCPRSNRLRTKDGLHRIIVLDIHIVSVWSVWSKSSVKDEFDCRYQYRTEVDYFFIKIKNTFEMGKKKVMNVMILQRRLSWRLGRFDTSPHSMESIRYYDIMSFKNLSPDYTICKLSLTSLRWIKWNTVVKKKTLLYSTVLYFTLPSNLT